MDRIAFSRDRGEGDETMKKRNDTVRFFFSCDRSGRTRSFRLGGNFFRALYVSLATLAVAGTVSFFLSYKFYNDSQTIRAEKEVELSLLLNATGMPSRALVDENLGERFVQRLVQIEKKLLSMEKILSKKGLAEKLSMGGRGPGVENLDLGYFDAMEKDIDKVSGALRTVPIGRPSSGAVTSSFGYRKSPFSNKAEFHGGIDFRGTAGDSVTATADGVVEKAEWVGGYGRTVVVRHKKGYKTLYAHLSKINVAGGQRVSVGDIIGEVGSSGRSTGPHLHYEITRYGKRLDPKRYVSPR